MTEAVRCDVSKDTEDFLNQLFSTVISGQNVKANTRHLVQGARIGHTTPIRPMDAITSMLED